MISKSEIQTILSYNILGFWRENMTDQQCGGFYGRIDGRGNLHPDADKSIILNARILWTFAAAFEYSADPRDRSMAFRAFDYMTNFFVDKKYGGVYWMLDNKGKVVNDKKQIYAQAFAIYALTQYHRISDSKEALDLAIRIFHLIEVHSFDPEKNGYLEAFSRSWGPLPDVRLSDKDMNATKTMNTHLHILEAYTLLYKTWPDGRLQIQLKNLIRLIRNKFLYKNNHFKLFFDDNWTLLSDVISFGHDIEGSWLLCEAAEALHSAPLKKEIDQLALKMTKAALEGMDDDGGLMNESNSNGLTDTDKHWWPQAEALVGLMNAWQISGDPFYRDKMYQVWDFIQTNIIDPSGEWFWKVSRDHKTDLDEDKAGPWKCPYHNGRAMMELHRRLSTGI